MAKSLDQVNMEEEVEANQGAKVSGEDVEIAFRMAVQMLNEGGGLDLIRKTINESNDPAQVIGQFLAQIMGQLAEQLQQEVGVDPRIFLAKDGWLDLMLDYIEDQLGYPEEFSDEIYTQVLEVIKAAAQGPQAPNNVTGQEAAPGTPPPVPPQAAPQQGMPPQGMM